MVSHLASGRGCGCVVLPYGGMVTTNSTLTNECAYVHFLFDFCIGSGRPAAVHYPYLRLHTEPCGSFARANAERKQQWGGECFGVSEVQ